MKNIRLSISKHRKSIVIYTALLGAGLVIGHAHGQASRQAPADHEGVSVVQLGL